MNTKPTFPNGYKVQDSHIQARIFAREGAEIYELDSGNFLYILPQDLNPTSQNIQKHNIFTINLGKTPLRALISSKNFSRNLSDFLNNLQSARGFDSVAGMDDLKATLIKDIINPLTQKAKYNKFKISIPNGILLYGPPGCGKTYIVQKLAEELGYHFLEVKHSDVSSPYIHGGVGKIAEVFKKAKQNAPTIMFIDELDGLMPKRSELGGHQNYKLEEINEFLMHLNEASKSDILVIGATNQLHLIDEAIIRPGRFDKKILVPPPDLKARIHLFKMYLEERPLKNVNYEILASKTQNYSSADIRLICDESARIAVVSNLDCIDMKLLSDTISKIPSSLLNLI